VHDNPGLCYLPTCLIVGLLFPLENERSRLLKKLFLPAQRPTLHPNNVHVFQNDRSKGEEV
jgi:hypothetical protein